MNKKLITIIGSGLLVTSLAIAGTGIAQTKANEVRTGTIRIEKQSEADYPAMAKLMPEQAAQLALQAAPGKVLKTELEDENGFLVYGVEVVTPEKDILDVKIDAGSGEILAMQKDKLDNNEEHDEEGESESEGR
ncbi:MAG: PepSY domain-containing protein [Dissulfuribacterales bacterium]